MVCVFCILKVKTFGVLLITGMRMKTTSKARGLEQVMVELQPVGAHQKRQNNKTSAYRAV